MKRKISMACALALLLLTGCRQHYAMTAIDRTRVLIDSRYDVANAAVDEFLKPYKATVDSAMSPVVGTASHAMAAHQPESDLSNLLADILVWGGQAFGEQPDLGIYNMGGIRASLAKGTVTYGDVLNVAPFENHICFLTLTGEQLVKLFEQVARTGGQGVSHGVRLVITRDGLLVEASLNGKAIDPKASYRIATLDYLAMGNDGLTAFKSGTDLVSPQGEQNDVRHIICNYFRAEQKAGRTVSAQEEGRIVVKTDKTFF